jgi:uncharacterized protein YndB with AHSA1/START domain
MTDSPDATSGALGIVLDAHTIRFERLLPGPIERVWSYLTDPERLATWLNRGEIPSEVGAEFRWSWNCEDEKPGGELRGRTRVYDPPHVLEYDWIETTAPGGPIRDSYVRFELQPQGDRVLLTLTHRALPADAFTTVAAGWHAHLDTLVATVSGIDGPDADTRYETLRPRYEALARDTT